MARQLSAKKVAAQASGHLDRSTAWNGLHSGDPVVVAGEEGRGVTWEFRAHVTNQRNGSQSVEVIGGGRGARTVRSFAPERIFAVTGKGRAPASLVDAPRLPFG